MRRVAVTGLGVISPVGNDVQSFWNSLVEGRHGIGPITKFDTADFKVKIAAEVKDFDPLRYLDKSDLRRTDLFNQYAVAASAQAMEDSGLEGHIDPERLGVYIGSGIGGLNTVSRELEKMMAGGPRRVSPFFVPMIISNMAAGTVAIRYHAMGPSLPVVSACATGTNSIGEAYRAIKDGYADAIIAGGAEASITPIAVAGFTNCMALCTSNDPDQASIPFDKRRSGFVIGEGAGIMVLEEYEHAKARGAKIYAEVTGYGNTCDAYHITAPQPEAVASSRAISLALEEAGITEGKGLYINAHGTSTPQNDKIETLAIKKALGDGAYDCCISSIKSMTGHMLGAAGGAEAIATALTLKTGIVPPTIGYQEADPECDLNYVPNQAVKADPVCAISSSFGFGGHNACIAMRKAED